MQDKTVNENGHERGLIENGKSRIWMRPDGILQIAFNPGSSVEVEDTKSITAALDRLAKGNKAPYLVDARNVISVTRAARHYASSPEFARVRTASAIIVGSPLSRVLANFYLKLTPPPFPSRLFNQEKEALAWLQQFVEHHPS